MPIFNTFTSHDKNKLSICIAAIIVANDIFDFRTFV